MKRTTSEFNRSTTPTSIDNLKVGDIYESNVKILQAITDFSIVCGVSFVSMKTNITCYTTICASIIEGDNIDRDAQIANNWVTIREGIPTRKHHHFPLDKYVYGYLYNTLVCIWCHVLG